MATPLLARVLAAPIPVPTTDGKIHLAYELDLTNALGQDVTLRSVTVQAGDRSLLTLSGDELAAGPESWARTTPTTKFGPAQTAHRVARRRIWTKERRVPTTLAHHRRRPEADAATAARHHDRSTSHPSTVSTHEPAVISPPLDGPGWLDANGCCDMTAHRMALNPINGELWAAERFAIDYVQLQPDGTTLRWRQAEPECFPYFGADIHAVADGPVVAVLDGLPEQVAGRAPTGLRSSSTAATTWCRTSAAATTRSTRT